MKFEIGIDEAGRGAWAGPIVAGAIFIPIGRNSNPLPPSIRDSKELTAKQRELAFDYLTKHYLFGIGIVSSQKIDENGLTWANIEVMKGAVKSLRKKLLIPPKTELLVDGKDIGLYIEGLTLPRYIIDGDRKIPSISAASIIAKVYRDKYMCDLSKRVIGYGFESHKGYGTKSHSESLNQLGVSLQHRKSYKPIMTYMAKQTNNSAL
jgi:ribonuclease HII